MQNNKLAIKGGTPVRNTPYPIHNTMLDYREEELVLKVMRSGHLSGFSGRPGQRFLGGPMVRQFENDIQEYFKIKHAVSFNSASTTLQGMISSIGVGPGDEVIVTPFTMMATSTAIVLQNAIPVFADIEDETFGLDPNSVREKITSNTKAILTVNLFGHSSKLTELKSIAREHNLFLLEDNAQSPGAICQHRLTGTIGDIGALSFNYHKVIQTGEGGMALTNNDDLAEHMRLVRNHGEAVVGLTEDLDQGMLPNMVGSNYRMTEIQAAIGIPQLSKLDFLNTCRVRLASLLTEQLSDCEFLTLPETRQGDSHVYYQYPMRFHKDAIGISRTSFVSAMQGEGISISEGYVRPIYLEPMYQNMMGYGEAGCPFRCPMYSGEVDYSKGLCPTAERIHFEEIITTDICKYPNTEHEVFEFVKAAKKIYANVSQLWE